MGDKLKQLSTHVQRSSIMSYIKHLKFKIKQNIIIGAVSTILLLTIFITLMFDNSVKYISVVQNGQTVVLETKKSNLRAFLDEQSIDVGKYDQISMDYKEKLNDGDIFEIERAMPIQLTIDGETQERFTVGKTVKDAIQDLKIELNSEDRVVPDLNTKINDGDQIEVIRVDTVLEKREEIKPFQLVTQEDNTLVKGKEKVIQEGKDGVSVLTVKKVIENGIKISEAVIEEEVVTHSFAKIIAVGTKNPVVILSASSPDQQQVSKEGMTFGVKQVLTDVTLTAYDAGLNSTGKTPDDPLYGITFSGAKVKAGHTVAVDPKVIPLGWWIYIEGVGLRKAEDIGSAIKGKKVDIYMDSEAQANKFGRQFGNTVYVIGPNKPLLN